jgi:iron complex outermembrane receptor protein
MKMNTNKTTLALMIASCFVTSAIAQETKTLSSVVVTATRVAQDSFDLPMAIDKVEKSAIEDSQLRMTLSESLARVPGITAQNRNQMAQDPQISSRGFGARSAFGVRGIRIYVDGIPLSMPDGIGNPGSVDLDTIGSIEVMRGPFSAMYGNSSGGVIQMFTRPTPKTPEVSGDVLFGSFGTRRESVQAAGTRQGVDYLLNFSNFESDGYRAQSANEKRQATVKLGVKLSDDTKLTTLIN